MTKSDIPLCTLVPARPTGCLNPLRSQSLGIIRRAFSGQESRFGVFSIRGGYLHSKLLIVDDIYALVGSANANGRSLLLDTEMAVAWVDAWQPGEFSSKWHSCAASAGGAQGAVIEHPSAKAETALIRNLVRYLPGLDIRSLERYV